jgi:hypothetical protein
MICEQLQLQTCERVPTLGSSYRDTLSVGSVLRGDYCANR